MTFSRANPGGWVDADVSNPITADQLNEIDVNLTRAIDGTHGGISCPTVGDPIRVGGTQGIIYDTTPGSPGGVIRLGPRTVIRQNNARAAAVGFDENDTGGGSSVWSPNSGFEWQKMTNGLTQLCFPLDIPHNSLLAGIEVSYTGGTGHFENPVNTGTDAIQMPSIALLKVGSEVYPPAPNEIAIAEKIDDVTNRTLYEDYHTIQLGYPPDFELTVGLNERIDNENFRYVLLFTGEADGPFPSTGWQPGSLVGNIKCYVVCTEYTEY